MMKSRKVKRLLVGGILLFASGALMAAPRVVVSISPLHSLVSALMEGAGQPELLFGDVDAVNVTLDPFQSSRVISADLLVWVGPGLERPLAEAAMAMPAIDRKMVTLSNYLPLMRRPGQQDPTLSRQEAHDLSFWQDPRLTIMAVRRITPLLVRLDPDHQELYLDNEIRLLGRLKALEGEIGSLLAPYGPVSPTSLKGFNRYFVHRFVPVDRGAGALMKVSTAPQTGCAAPSPQDTRPGMNHYFDSLRETASFLTTCLDRLDRNFTAGKKPMELSEEEA